MQTWAEKVIDQYLEEGPVPPGDYTVEMHDGDDGTEVETKVFKAGEEIASVKIAAVEYVARCSMWVRLLENLGLVKRRFVQISPREASDVLSAITTSIFCNYKGDVGDLPMVIH